MATVTKKSKANSNGKAIRKSQPARPRAFYVPLIREAGRLRAHGHTNAEILARIGITAKVYEDWRWRLKDVFNEGLAQGTEEYRLKFATLQTALGDDPDSAAPSLEPRKRRVIRGEEFWRAAILDAGRLDARGHNGDAIAAKFEVSRNTYFQWRNRYRPDFDSARKSELAVMHKQNEEKAAQTAAPVHGFRKSAAVVAEAARLRAKGLTLKETAEQIGAADSTISDWEKKADPLWQDAFTEERERQRSADLAECEIEKADGDLIRAIRIAAALKVGGFPWLETAEALNLECSIVQKWPITFATIWKKAFKFASLLANPRQFARKLLDEGAMDIPPADASPERSEGGRWTLREFFDNCYRQRLKTKGCAQRTSDIYEWCLSRWEALTANPSIDAIDDDTISDFVCQMTAATSAVTANHARRHILTILGYAGPRSPWRPGAREIITKVPYCDKVREIKRSPIAWTLSEVEQLLTACRSEPGEISGVPACDWWTAFVLLSLDTGLRRGAMLSILCADVDLEKRTVRVRGEFQKHRADQLSTFSEQTADWLRRIMEAKRDRLFDWQYDAYEGATMTAFGRRFGRIHKRAGLPLDDGMSQRLRRTSATWVASRGGQAAATRHLHHSSPSLARDHYIDPNGIPLDRFADSMPRPEVSDRKDEPMAGEPSA